VLSGYADEGQSARLLTVAHQYMSKPCEVQQLENIVNRCMQLHELLKDPRWRAVVGRIKQLPALPRTYANLRDTMARGDATVQDVSRVISADSAIAAKVLQIVNSAFFRLARRVTKIEQAVTYLGFLAIRNIAMSIELFSQWERGKLPEGFDPEQLQLQAQKIATVARALTANTPLVDDAMLSGLLHNIGYCVLVLECPDDMARATQLAHEQGIAIHEAQRQVIGATHAEVGAYLLGIWGLPYQIIEAVAFQHSARSVNQASFDVLAALAVAQVLVSADNAETIEGVPGDEYLQSVNAPFDWAEAKRRAEKALGELSE
jgi:HD-like signal output (HDOD) protein